MGVVSSHLSLNSRNSEYFYAKVRIKHTAFNYLSVALLAILLKEERTVYIFH
jgi:hypothetical protein